jgi:hypothetical protein
MKEFLPDGMDFDEIILKAKESYRKYRDRILEERKEEAKKHVHRRNRQIKNKIFFVNICTHEKVLRLLII